MNIERWIQSRQRLWQRLNDILVAIEKQGMAGLSNQDLGDLGELYRTTSADLSRARSANLPPSLCSYLNNLVVRAHNQVYSAKHNRLADLAHFFWLTFPRLVSENILYVFLSIALFGSAVGISYWEVHNDINFAHLALLKNCPLVPDDLWHSIEQKHMWTNSLQNMSPIASSAIASNNLRVAILGFALGMTCGLGTIFVLISNGMFIGTIFGVCQKYGMARDLLTFVMPHGVLELSAIFISSAAGLVLGKAILFTGKYSRLHSVQIAAKKSLGLFAGCIPLLLIAGIIEGFISPRPEITAGAKCALSFASLICLFGYLFIPRGQPGGKT